MGHINKGETPLEAAKRELEEEVGYSSDNLEMIATIGSSIGITNEIVHIFIARDLKESKTNFDEGEYITSQKQSIESMIKKVENGEIIAAPIVVAVQYLQLNGYAD